MKLAFFLTTFLIWEVIDAGNKHNFPNDNQTTIADDCPANCRTCIPEDPSLFAANGDVKDPSRFGTWVTSTSCGNKKYLFSNCGLTWSEAMDQCCRLRMRLVSFPTKDLYTCFANAAPVAQGEWWTSGTDEGCTDKTRLIFSWCSNPPKVFNDTHYTDRDEWEKKEPNNAGDLEKCVKIEKNGSRTRLSDKSCNTLYKFACEERPVCQTYENAVCPTCIAKDPSLFESDGTTIKNPSQYGTFIDTSCNRRFLVSSNMLSRFAAHDLCCKLGMQLYSGTSDALLNCVEALSAVQLNTHYWTSAVMKGCKVVPPKFPYRWCNSADNPAVNNSIWDTNEPDFITSGDLCALFDQHTVGTAPVKLFLYSANCGSAKRFLCEKVIP